MPPRLVSDHDLSQRLTDLFRTTGFDGASLNDIAEATGLQKSSLYHRFPGGKQQMAAEAIAAVGELFAADVLQPLANAGAPSDRIRAVGRRLRTFYDNGARSCLLDVLSIGDVGPAASGDLAGAATVWVQAFASVAVEAGASPAAATAHAQDAIASIEGALVLARVTGDRRPFDRAIKRLPDVLLATSGRNDD